MKKVFAFGLDLEVEGWVKFLAVDLDDEVWGFEAQPFLDSDVIWQAQLFYNRCVMVGAINDPYTENSLLIVGV